MGYAIHFVAGRGFGPTIYGEIGLAISTLTILNFLLTTGAANSVAREVLDNGEKANISAFAIASLFLSFAGVVFAAILAFLPAAWEAPTHPLLLVAAVALPAYAASAITLGVQIAQQRFRAHAGSQIAGLLIRLGVAVAAAFLLHSPTTLLLAYAAGSLAGALILAPTLRPFSVKPNLDAIGAAAKSTISSSIASFLVFWLFSMDVLLIAFFGKNASETGFYVAASTIAKAPFYLSSAYGVSLFTEATKEGVSGVWVLRRMALALAACVLWTLVLAAFGPLVVGLLYGSAFQVSAPLLLLLGLSAIPLSVLNVSAPILFVRRQTTWACTIMGGSAAFFGFAAILVGVAPLQLGAIYLSILSFAGILVLVTLRQKRRNPQESNCVIVLATTYPRWQNDSTPAFVHRLTTSLGPGGIKSIVLAPHHAGAKQREILDGVEVVRYPYWLPLAGQRLCYEGGILANISKAPIRRVQLLPLLLMQFLYGLSKARASNAVAINAHWFFPGGMVGALVAKIRRVPLVTSIHGSDLEAAARIPKALARSIFRATDVFACNSSSTSGQLTKLAIAIGAAPPRYELIPMGIDPPEKPTTAKRADAPRIIFVGRLSPEKNVNSLVVAFGQVKAFIPNAELHVVGGGPLQNELADEARALKLQDVIFHGFQSPRELPRLYAEAWVACFPSWREGQGLALLEALASGIPVVSGKVGIAPDVIVSGTNGILVDQPTPEALASALIAVLKDPSGMTAGARRTNLAAFSWPEVARSYARVFRTLAPRQPT